MKPSPVVATIAPKRSSEIVKLLVILFTGYDVPFGDGAETRKVKVTGYVWACEGRPVALVERVVKDFLSGKVKRSPSLRSKLPTAEEFAAQLNAREAEGGDTVSDVPGGVAPPFGPLWMAKLLSILLCGPEETSVKPSMFIAGMIAKGGEIGERYQLQHQAATGFPKARAMLSRADEALGSRVGEEFAPMAELMEPVPVTGEVFAAWQADFERRGWPWLPRTGKQRVVYFPKGGPAGLDAVAAALMRVAGGGSELSTSSRDRRGEVSA
jgi:hypothetical protein